MSHMDKWLDMGRAGPYASAEEAVKNLERDLTRMKDHCEQFSSYAQRGFVQAGQWTVDEIHIVNNKVGWVTEITHTIPVQKT